MNEGIRLSNSSFLVILFFRENAVSISGDRSKMYHRILIPERDQQVQCFLWRNFETDRDLMFMSKLSLPFGDKPAPAMAQMVLKKTAEQEVDVYPDVYPEVVAEKLR